MASSLNRVAGFTPELAREIARFVREEMRRTRAPVNTINGRWPSVPANVAFRVKLVQIGGSNGSNTLAPTYTYDVYNVADTGNVDKLNASALSPDQSRPVGTVTAATMGLAYYDGDGALKLYEAWEKPGAVESCS